MSNRGHVFVTGATGHLGGELCRQLIEAGKSVVALVRSRTAEPALRLGRLGIELVLGDIRDAGAVLTGARQADAIVHCASVYRFAARSRDESIVRPAVEGVRNVMTAAARTRTRRVVITSSAVTLGMSRGATDPRGADDWLSNPRDSYVQAKVESEKLAWKLAEELGVNLATVLPPVILGPNFERHTPSTEFVQQALDGAIPFALPMTFSFVDVRDVARLHAALIDRSERERVLAHGHVHSLRELFQAIERAAPDARAPRFAVPRALLPIVPGVDWVLSKLRQRPRLVTANFVAEFGAGQQRLSDGGCWQLAGIRPRSFEETVTDTVTWLRCGVLAPRAA